MNKPKKKTIKELEMEKVVIEQSQIAKQKEYKRIGDQLLVMIKKRDKINEEIDALVAKGFKTKKSKPTWDWLLATDQYGNQTAIRHAALKKVLPDFDVLSSSGYYYQTQQLGLKLCLRKYDTEGTARAYELLKEILPYIKSVEDKGESFKRISIFENTLSENGSYCVEITNLNEAHLVIYRYGRRHELKKDTLKKILEYIQRNLYYGDEEDDDEGFL